MNSMKLQFNLLATLLLFTVIAVAQPPQGGQRMNPEERVKQQTEQLVKDLGLTEAQKVKVEAINKKYGEKMAELSKEAGGDRAKSREKMMELRKAKDAELKAVFTAEQNTKYLALEKQRMEERRKNNQNGTENPNKKRGEQRGTGVKK
jgi:Spy/CpxP family protein refolding chaperone